jgi:hypothetical protein
MEHRPEEIPALHRGCNGTPRPTTTRSVCRARGFVLTVALPRVEGEEVTGALAERFPDTRPESETKRLAQNMAFPGLESRPLRFS